MTTYEFMIPNFIKLVTIIYLTKIITINHNHIIFMKLFVTKHTYL